MQKKNIKAVGGLSYTQQLKKQKREKLFWQSLGFNEISAIPQNLRRVNLRYSNVNDEELSFLVDKVHSIEMLDLDETMITNEGVSHLTKLERLAELRLKNCTEINSECIQYICKIESLELLHLGGSSIHIRIDDLTGMESLQNLKTLLVTADDDEVVDEKMIKLRAQLPKCDFIINHTPYNK